MIEALSSCDTVIAVSEFVRRMFESAGVQPDRLRTLHIGTALADQAVRRSEPVHPPGGASSARHLAFIGYDSWYKGLPMLVESLELLTPEFLSQIHLTILAFNEGVTQRDLRRLEPRLAGLIIRGRYQQNDLPWLLAGIDMGIVPSVWWDNGPQTALEFLACGIPVLGAELGGIPDFIHHEQNGLLFRGNDRWDLARTLASIVRDPSCVARLRAGVRPPKGVRRHAAELEDVYSGRVS
jgi:glycosyltransferase involved in cell wall biosynthesis